MHLKCPRNKIPRLRKLTTVVKIPKEENHNYNKETVSKSFKDVLMDVNGDKTHKE